MSRLALALLFVPACLPALSWDEALREAARANSSVLSAGEELKGAEAGKKSTRSLFLPKVDASGRVGRSGSEAVSNGGSALPPGAGEKESSSYSVGLNASWRLFNGFADWRSLEESQYTLLGQMASLASVQAQARRNLRYAFLHVLYAQGQLAVAEDIRSRRAQSTLYQKLKFESGRQARWTWKKAAADEADALWRAEQGAADLEVALAELAQALGRPDSQGLSAEGSLAPAEPGALDLSVLEAHPSAKRARFRRLGAEARLGKQRAGHLPTLSASAGWSYGGADQWPPDTRTWSAALSAGFDLFSGGATSYGVDAAEASLRALEHDEAEQLRELRSAVRRAHARAVSAARQVGVADLQLEAARERYETVAKLYQAGRAGFLDLEQAESGLTSAQQQGLGLRQSAGQALADLEWALGVGFSDLEARR